MFFKFKLSSSDLKKFDFDNYLDTQESLDNAKEDLLSVANLLLQEPMTKGKKLRLEAGYFLSDWMMNTDNYMFGTGNLKSLFDNKEELAVISLAAQVKYCLEKGARSSSDPIVKLGIWKLITNYVENPTNKVKLTKNLKRLISAKTENGLPQFLEENG